MRGKIIGYSSYTSSNKDQTPMLALCIQNPVSDEWNGIQAQVVRFKRSLLRDSIKSQHLDIIDDKDLMGKSLFYAPSYFNNMCFGNDIMFLPDGE